MSLFAFTLMPFVVLILGVVVSLVVVGGIADANQQAKRFQSLGRGSKRSKANVTSEESKILHFDHSRKVS